MQMYHGTRPTKFGHRGYEYADTGEPVPPEVELTTRPEGGTEAAESTHHLNYSLRFILTSSGNLAMIGFGRTCDAPRVSVDGAPLSITITVVQDTPSLTLAVERVKDFVAKGGAKGVSPERVEAMLNGMAGIL